MRTPDTIRFALLPVTVLSLCLVFGCAEDEAVDLADPNEAGYDEGPPLSGKADDALATSPAYAALPDGAVLDRPFEAMFAPDDPVVSVELALIDEVLAARAQDSATYAEGENPFRIRYAVYNLRNPNIVAKLADAEDQGVDVQILIESHQLSPAKTWNTADEDLTARGFELVEDHTRMTSSERVTADLIGIVDKGLMHMKARIFTYPGGEALLTGSMNPGDNAVLNEETLHLVRDAALIQRYRVAYESVLKDSKIPNTWDADAAVNVLFSPAKSGPRAGAKLFEWLEAEQEQILLMVFSLRDINAKGASGSLVDVLAEKAASGIPVIVITDRKQADGVDANGNRMAWDDKTDDRLRQAGVRVYEATNRSTDYTAMHHKVGIFGRTNVRVVTDAANWTTAALGTPSKTSKNVESMLFIDSAALDGGRTGRRYLAQWLRVLSRYADESVGLDGEASYETIAAELLTQEGWPTLQVAFTAHDVLTEWGQNAAVAGDRPELGSWGESAPHTLWTTDGLYPTWQSWEPVAMPLGVTIAWKLVVVDSGDGTVQRWEYGDDHHSRVAEAALLPTDWLRLSATWR